MNDLVEPPRDSTEPDTGIGLAEAVADVVRGIEDGDWAEIGFGAAGGGLELLSAVIDPLGTVFSWSLSWLMEHVQPLTDMLDWLAGNADEVAAQAGSWRNVGDSLHRTSEALRADVRRATQDWTGAAADAYRSRAAMVTDLVQAQARAANGMGAATELAGVVVAVTREAVRDFVADCVGRLAAWALEAASVIGIPAVIAQAGTRVARWVARIADMVRELLRVLGKLLPLLGKLGDLIGRLRKLLDDIGDARPLPRIPDRPRPRMPETPKEPPSRTDPGSHRDDPPDDPPGDTPPRTPDDGDPFDRLPPHEREALIERLRKDSRYGLSHDAAEASLRRGPPGTVPFVGDRNAPGADIRFRDAAGNDVLERECKVISGTENSFNNEIRKGVRQIGGDGEVFFQVPDRVDRDVINSWLDRWRGRPGRDVGDYEEVDVIFCDSSGNLLGRANLAYGSVG